MTTTTEFPSSLPLPLNRMTSANAPGVLNNDFRNGSPFILKFTDSESLVYDLNWIFTESQLQVFQSFFSVTLNRGSKWFLLDIPWLTEGQSLRTMEVNFDSTTYTASNAGKLKRVSAQVLIRNPHRDNMDFYNAYLPLVPLGDDIRDLIDRLEIFANEDMPDNIPS